MTTAFVLWLEGFGVTFLACELLKPEWHSALNLGFSAAWPITVPALCIYSMVKK